MAHIAQAYFHFKTRPSAKDAKSFGRRIDVVARQAARANFDFYVQILVELEDGSLVGRVSVFAAAIALWTGLISDYKGVRESARLMCEDARSFGFDVCNKAIEIAGISNKQIVRTERRTKVLGKISRLLNDLYRLERSMDELSPKQMKEELARAARELRAISRQLEPQEQALFVRILEHTKLPPPRKWPRHSDVDSPRVALKPEQLALGEETLGIDGPQDDAGGATLYKHTFSVPAKGKHRRRRLSGSKKLIESQSTL